MDQITPATSNLAVSDNRANTNNYDPHEIASLLGNYYHLLARMRYIPHSTIKHPPHSPAIDVSLAESLDLEPQVIELLQLLPYVEGRGSEDEFILQGGFEDFRNIRNLRQSRDPDYASPEGGYEEEGGEYVRPWVLPLNQCGNHGSIMYLDTRNGHITMQWQAGAGGGPADPYFKEHGSPPCPPPHPVNENRFDHYPSRHARDLFADFTNRLMTLEWIPIDAYRIIMSWDPIYDEWKSMFLTYGWPDNFDGEDFDAAAKRWAEFDRVRYGVEDENRELKTFQSWVKHGERDVQGLEKRRVGGTWDGDPSKSVDEVQKLEEQLEQSRENLERTKKDLVKAREDLDALKGMTNDQLMERSWRKHIEGGIKRKRKELTWYRGDVGKQFLTEEKERELEVGIAALEERLQYVTELPKTPMDAIQRQEGHVSYMC